MTHAQTSIAVERELATEQAHVDLVYARLAEATRSAEEVARAGRALYQSDRETYLREEDGTGLYERDVFAFQAARRLAVLDAEHEGLVFGRLDRTDGEIRYVGRIGVRDADYEPLVVDWRAPAAEPFYRATPAVPMDVVRRRVLRCSGETVVGISDDLLDSEHANGDLVVLGEGALMAALTRARGHTMRDIVATIQAEQDEAIRAPYQGFTMITGGPGTGKTVVALHRAAYLLYSNRRRFESGGVLVVGPSRVFMSYIEQVLPSLGEESVTLRPIGAVAADVVAVTGEQVDPPATAAVKGSLRMTRVLRALVREPPPNAPKELRVSVKGHVLVLPAGALDQVRLEVLAHHKLNTGREAAEKAVLAALWRMRPPELDLDREDFDDRGRRNVRAGRVLAGLVAGGHSAGRAGPPGRPGPAASVVRLGAVQCRVRPGQRQLRRNAAERSDWTVADGALLDELVTPARTGASAGGGRDLVVPGRRLSDVSEVVTTADRLTRGARGSTRSPSRRPDVRAHPGRRGPGHHADAVADAPTTGAERQLDHRRRSGPELLAGPAEADRALNEIIGTAPVRTGSG